MIFMLSEMRNRTDPEEKNRVWQLIGNIYSRHVRQMRKAQMPLHTALQNLIVKAWRAYIEECNLHHRTPTSCPTIVKELLEDSKGSTEAQPAEQNDGMIEQSAIFQDQLGREASNVDLVEPGNFDFLLSESPMDWNEWDNLLNQFQESLVDDMAFMPGSGSYC